VSEEDTKITVSECEKMINDLLTSEIENKLVFTTYKPHSKEIIEYVMQFFPSLICSIKKEQTRDVITVRKSNGRKEQTTESNKVQGTDSEKEPEKA
jgi:hypothetical protein